MARFSGIAIEEEEKASGPRFKGIPAQRQAGPVETSVQRAREAVAPVVEEVSGFLPSVRQVGEGLVDEATSREGFTAIGATAGAIAGTPFGGPAGAAAGGALGAAIGSSLFDTKEVFFGNEDFEFSSQVLEATEAGTIDAAFSLGLGAVGTLAKQLGGRILGLGKEQAQELAQASVRQDIPLGAFHLFDGSRKSAANVFARTGGVFPLVGAPFKASQKEVNKAYLGAWDRTLDTLAPVETLHQLSPKILRGARQTYLRNKAVVDSVYENVRLKVAELPRQDIFPGNGIRHQAVALRQSIQEALPALEGDSVAKDLRLSPGIKQFLTDLSQLSERQTLGQIRGIKQTAGDLMKGDGVTDTDIRTLQQIRVAAEQALNNPNVADLPQGAAEEVVGALKTANKTFVRLMKKPFENPTARKFERVDKNIFGAGAKEPGTKEIDEVLAAAFNTRSPQAMKNLRGIVPFRAYKGSVREYLEGAYQKSLRPDTTSAQSNFVLDPRKLKKNLGLVTRQGRETLDEMLKGTGISRQAIDDLVKIAEAADGVVIPNTSSFVFRRLMLGGVGAAASTFVGGGAGLGAYLSAVALSNAGGRFITSPQRMRELARLTTLDPNSAAFRQQAIRVARFVLAEDEEETD